MDFYFFKLCWKNIWRNKRRTLITVNAIGVGVMALVVILNYYDGFHEQVIQNVIRYHSGHLLISAPGYFSNNIASRYIKDPSPMEKWLNNASEIKASSSRILVQGMLSSPQGSANILFTGIEPKKEAKVTRFKANIVQGDYLANPKINGVVLGKKLAQLLKLKLGSKVVALTQGVDGSIGNELFYVEGIFDTQSDLDKSLAFITLTNAQKLLSVPKNGVHQIAIVLKTESELPIVQKKLQDRFPKHQAEILSWMQLQRPLMAMIELNKSANSLLMIIILFIAAMGIANSILMSILERTREFGVMMAIGTTKKEVISMVITETFLLSAVGVAFGNILGVGLTLYFHTRGFDLKWLTSQKIVVQGTIIQTVSYPNVHWNNSLTITLMILGLSMLVSFFPVRHISNLNPVKALRAH